MDYMLSQSTILFDVCPSMNTCRYLPFPEYFLLADSGIDVLVTHVTRLRGGFEGAIFQYEPACKYDHDRGHWEKLLAMPMKSVPVENQDFWLGSTLGVLAHRNNFSFESSSSGNAIANFERDCAVGTISMGVSSICSSKYRCPHHRDVIALLDFTFYSTLLSSELPIHRTYQLSSLTLHVSPTAALVLLALTLGIGLLFLVKSGNRDLSVALLLALPSFWVQAGAHRPLGTQVFCLHDLALTRHHHFYNLFKPTSKRKRDHHPGHNGEQAVL